LPELKSLLEKKFKDFNVEDYGFNKFGKFIDSLGGLDVDKNTVVLSKSMVEDK
jgi:hypothetical protein